MSSTETVLKNAFGTHLRMIKCMLRSAAGLVAVVLALARTSPTIASETQVPGGTRIDVTSSDAVAGGIEGVVRYEADSKRSWPRSRYYIHGPSGSLAESVVALEGPTLSSSASTSEPQTKTLNQINFQFVPETLVVRAGDHIRITNGDEALHNVTSLDGGMPFNVNVSKSQQLVRTFEQAGGLEKPVRLSCLFHGGMRAWIYVFDHPWFQLTQTDGRFRFEQVPPGEYSLGVVHPGGKLRWRRPIVVKTNELTRITITLSPNDLINVDAKSN